MFDYTDEALAKAIVGKLVTGILMSEDVLQFEYDDGTENGSLVTYRVDGDCCSYSYFFDFYGVEKLIGARVTAFEPVELQEGDPGWLSEDQREVDWETTEVYGYRLTVEHATLGPLSAVVSFRNKSNGYYGGWMEIVDDMSHFNAHLPEDWRLTEDRIGG